MCSALDSSSTVAYEPFLGSGTTLIAAEATGRVCLAVEIDPFYVDVAVRRWQAFTGKQAILLASGLTFDSISAERTKQSRAHKSTCTEKPKRSSRRSAKGA